MSNATPDSRPPGQQSKRRRSRGGKNRNKQNDNRRGNAERGPREARSEEFRPQGPRPPRNRPPVELNWWQKLLKAVGLYKEPVQPARKPKETPPKSEPQNVRSENRPPKSNTRVARTGDGEKPRQAQEKQPRRNTRGGDGSSVESPRVYVANLSYDVTEQDLQELFKGIGAVRNVEIIYNRSTHRSKGFGFVEMLHKDEAVRAVEVLHDQHFMGRKLTVSGAKTRGLDEREDRDDREGDVSRTVSLAPLPAASSQQVDSEPTIQTIVETVTDVGETQAAPEEERRSEVA